MESTPMKTTLACWHEAEQCRDERRWDEADALYRAAISLQDGSAVRFAYGTFLAERQNYASALPELMQALDGAQRDRDLDLQALIFSNLASIYRELGNRDLAQRFQKQVLALQGAADASDLIAWCHDALMARKATLAESLARQAMELVEDSEDIETLADIYGLLGVIAARNGSLRRAVWFLCRAIRGHHCASDDRGLGTDYLNLAEVFGLLGRVRWQHSALLAAANCFARQELSASAQRAAERLQDWHRLDHYRRTSAEWN